MRLVYINQSISNSAGMERMLINKANYFSEKKGYEVYIITTDQDGRPPFFSISNKVNLIDLGINFYEYSGLNIFQKLLSFYSKRRIYRKSLDIILTEICPDVVITMMFKNLDFLHKIRDGSMKVVELHFSRKGRRQLLEETNWSSFHKLVYSLRERLEIKYISRYDHFVILTEQDRRLWGSTLNNIKVIPNYLPDYPSVKAELEERIVLSVGRLDYQKGYDILIPIWKEVVKVCPDWKLHIYGNGPMESQLLEMIEKEEVVNSVAIFPPTKEISQKYYRSSIYVMTSRFEGLPLVLIEAMAAGLPAVSFNCECGPMDIISDGVDGYLIDEGDRSMFANKLIELMQDASKRVNMGGAAHINMQKFAEKNIMSQWDQLFLSTERLNEK